MIEPTEGESWANCPCPDSGCGCEEITLSGDELRALIDVKELGTERLVMRALPDGYVMAKHPDNAWAYDELMKMRGEPSA